jgi:hypothetical protein
LESSKNKENNEVSDVNAWRCWIKADIERDWLLQRFTQGFLIGRLGNKSTPLEVI